MGINTGRGGGQKTFLGVYSNELVMQFKDREELIKKLDNLGIEYDEEKDILERKIMKGKDEGKPMYYKTFWSVDGLLSNVYIKDTDWGELLEIEIRDVDEVFTISLGEVFQRLSKDFIRKVANVDLTEEVSFGIWNISADKSDDGKQRSGVRIHQGDEKIEYSVEYEEMPEPTSKKVGKKVKWNFDEQNDFLYGVLTEYLNENFKPKDVAEEEESASVIVDYKTRSLKPVRKTSTRKAKSAEPVGAKADDDLPF